MNAMMGKKRYDDDTDVTLVCPSTGTEFPCHKFILSGQSEVFKAMFASSWSEAKTNKVELTGVQNMTVDALLNYMYKGALEIPFSRSDVALDLLKVAHQYEIQPLVDKLLLILENEDLDKIPVSTAINMFSFALKLQDQDKFLGLMKKSVVIVKRNVKSLGDHPDFGDLFLENASLAKQLCIEIGKI